MYTGDRPKDHTSKDVEHSLSNVSLLENHTKRYYINTF